MRASIGYMRDNVIVPVRKIVKNSARNWVLLRVDYMHEVPKWFDVVCRDGSVIEVGLILNHDLHIRYIGWSDK
jgi:hypothetical protein